MTHFARPVLREKKSEFIGQLRATPEEKSKIRAALRYYGRDRAAMAWEVIAAHLHHHRNGDELVFPLRLVVVPKDSSAGDTAAPCT